MRGGLSCSAGWCLSTLGGLMGGAVNTVLGLASGAGGAFALDYLGYAGYVLLDGLKVGALGGFLVGSVGGVALGALTANGFFGRPDDHHENYTCSRVVPGVVALQAINGAVGYLVYVMLFKAGSSSSSWTTFGKVEAYMAVGSAPVAFLFMCCCTSVMMGIASCLWRCAADYVDDEENGQRRIIINAGVGERNRPYFALDIRHGRDAVRAGPAALAL